MIHNLFSRRQMASVLLVSYLLMPALSFAQVVINAGTPNDGRRAYVDQTQNGLPKINIATPNGAGVSHNVYQEFNVGKQGLILNNGASNSNTALAGWVEGNPNLTAGNEAKLIFNEVVGARQSQLNGFLEVAGKKADVIVANENGVTCNGCGFINTSRATLTTGTVIWGNGGSLDGLKVRQGTVTIGPDGLSSPDSRVDILSQAINIQGAVHADRLNLVAGNNDIGYGNLSVTPAAGTTGSIDVSLLGGMYANQIDLVATGAGVGVRVDGTLVSAGNVGITVDGQLVNTGGITAQGQLKTQTATGVENSGTLAAQNLELSADNFKNLGSGVVGVSGVSSLKLTTLNNLGRLHFEGDAQLDVRRINNPGQIESLGQFNTTQTWTINNTGGLYGNGISLNTQALGNTGRIQANDLSITAYTSNQIPSTDKLTDTVVNNSGLIAADHISLSGFGKLANSNQITTDVAWARSLVGSGQISLQANSIDNTGGTILAKSLLNLDTQELINTRATLSSKGDMRISASGSIDNREGLILHQGTGTASVQAAGAISNAKGQIEGQGESLSLTAGDIDNTEGQILQTSTRDALTQPSQLNITASAAGTNTGELRNIKGSIGGSGNVTITAHSYITDSSTASISSGGSLSFLNPSSTISNPTPVTGNYDWNSDIATAAAVATAKNSADQAAATAQQTAATLTSAQTTLQTAQATQTATQTAVTQAQAAVAAATTTAAKTAAQTTLDQLLVTQASNDAAVTQAQAALATAQTADTAAQAATQVAQQAYAQALAAVPAIQTGTSGTNTAQPTNPAALAAPTPPQITLASTTSQIQAARNLTFNLDGGLLDNRQGKLVAVRNLNASNTGNVLAGQMQAGSELSLTAAQLEVTQQLSASSIQIVADTLIVSGKVQGNDTLNIQANQLTNSGTLTGNTTTLKGRSSDMALQLGNTGLIQGNSGLSIQADQVLNQATLASGADLSTQTNNLENQALIYSSGNQTHLGQNIINNAGRFYALGDIAMQGNAAGDNASSILNYIGRIEAQGDIALKANTITNRAVAPTANARAIVTRTDDGSRITSTARDTFNTDGKTSGILAGKNLTLRADEVHNEYGVISARLNTNIGTRLLKNRAFGAIQTQNYVIRGACFNCHQTVSYAESWGGVIASGGTATINATTIENQTIDSRNGFAGISNAVDERAGTMSPLTQAFVDRFGIVTGPANNVASAASTSVNLGSPRVLSSGITLQPNGSFDFSHFSAPNPQTGLFEQAPVNSPYLIRGRSDLFAPASNDQYTSYNKFAGSDYLLTRLGLMPSGVKLLGDAWYETQLVQDQMYALKGRTHLVAGTDNDYDLMMHLMDAGLLAKAQFGFGLGDTLTAAQQAALTQDMVWPEWQVVDGQKVLVPKLYVAHQEQNNDSNKGARIVGTDVAITTRELENTGTLLASNSLAINASGKVSGGGNYSGGKAVAIVADSVDLKHASLQSGGWLSIDTANDLTLTATQVKADGDARLSAGGGIALNADKHEAHVVRGNGSSKDEVRYETSNVSAGGNLTIEGTKGVVAQGGKLEAGENFKLSSTQGNVDLQAVVDTENINPKGGRGGFFGWLWGGSTTQTQDIKGVQISAGGNAVVQASQGDVSAQSLQMHADEQAAIVAGAAVKLTSEQVYSKAQTGSNVRQSLVTERSQIEGDKGVTIYGQNLVQLDAVSVKASQGDVTVASAGDVNLGFNTDTQQHNWTTSSSSGNFISSTTTTTQHETLDKTAQVTQIEGQSIKVLGNNVQSLGAKLEGVQLVQVEGVNNTQLYSVQEVHQYTQNSQSSSDIMGFTYSSSSSSDSSLKSQALGTKLTSAEAVQIGVGAVTDVQGAILTAPNVNFVRSAGADTSKAGELILGGSTNTTQTSHTKTTTTAGVYQEQSGSGQTTQTLNQTQINGKVNITASINTTVMIPEGDLKNQVQQLSQQPGMAYIGEFAKDPKVNWQQVKLAYDKWDYSQEGLTPAGAALLAIAVAAASGGSAASLVNSMGFSGATAAAMTAGLITLAASAAVSFVNNGGDIGKTLKDMGSSQNVKGVLTAMATADVLTELGRTTTATGQAGANAQAISTTQAVDKFTVNLMQNVTSNMASAVVSSAINGKSLDEETLSTVLTSAFITAGMAQSANSIGAATQSGALNSYTQAMAHALVGCVGGTATTGNSGGCSAGAVGAVVGELSAGYAKSAGVTDANALAFAKSMGAVAGALVGGSGSAAAVNVAAQMGANAGANNYLLHNKLVDEEGELARLKLRKQSGQCDSSCDVRISELQTLDKLRDEQLAPLIDACEKAGRNNCKGEVIARQFAEVNGFGLESMKRESNAGTLGSPFSFNGCQGGDKGGCSYGPLQIAADTGMMSDFMEALRKNPAVEAQDFYGALQAAGGVNASQRKDPAFIQTWMQLTAKDPQFVQYQIDTLINQNLYPVVQELQKVGINFNDLSQAQKDAIFSAAVQHGAGVQAKKIGADNVLERSISIAQTDAQAPSFPTYTRQELVYGKVEDQMRAAEESKAKLIMQRESLIAQQLNFERQKNQLLEQGLRSESMDIPKIQNQVKALDQKIGDLSGQVDVLTNRVTAQNQYVQDAAQYLKSQAQGSLADGEQWLKDFYQQRTQMYPAEAKRYQLELESLLKQYREEQKAKTK